MTSITFGGRGTTNYPFAAIAGILGSDVGLEQSGDLAFYTKPTTTAVNPTERMRIDYSGNVGIGTSSPSYKLDVVTATSAVMRVTTSTATASTASLYLSVANNFSGTSQAFVQCIGSGSSGVSQLAFGTARSSGDTTATEAMRIDSSGNVGINTTSPNVSGQSANTRVVTISGSSINWGGVELNNPNAGSGNLLGFIGWTASNMTTGYNMPAYIGTWLASGTALKQGGELRFFTQSDNTAGATERMRIDSSGNVGIGNMNPNTWDSGSKALQIGVSGAIWNRASDNLFVLSSNAYFDGTYDRYITSGYASRMYQNSGSLHFQTASSGSANAQITSFADVLTLNNSASATYSMQMQNDSAFASMGTTNACWMYISSSQIRIIPRYVNGSVSDNIIDIGDAGSRMRVIYAGTGTINTSDANEKQDIQDFSDVEKRVAVKIKAMFKTYRFKDAVAEKGADARIHSGVIAQEVCDAFTSEGLDAHRYALFCSDTWYTVNNKDLKENGERFTADDEGAVERTRLGMRYSELLSFVISAI
jgi:hypothetical protein